MRVLILSNYGQLCKWTANYLSEKINHFSPSPEKPFLLGLPTGSSPIGVYAELIKLYKKGVVSFKNVVTFNMDEYVDIPENHPESFHYFMNKNLFNHINIPQKNINILNGNAPDLEKECFDFEEKIKDFGGIQLFLGGIGPNGHLAFNEPGSSIHSKTRVITLTPETIISNSRFFFNNINLVPKRALTVGIETVMQAKEVVIIANGLNKASVIKKVIEEGVNSLCPVSVIQLHQKSMIVCDKEAAAKLKFETVEYYNAIEKIGKLTH